MVLTNESELKKGITKTIKCPNDKCGATCNAFESHKCKACGRELNPGDFE